jgi:hypothetical protein
MLNTETSCYPWTMVVSVSDFGRIILNHIIEGSKVHALVVCCIVLQKKTLLIWSSMYRLHFWRKKISFLSYPEQKNKERTIFSCG